MERSFQCLWEAGRSSNCNMETELTGLKLFFAFTFSRLVSDRDMNIFQRMQSWRSMCPSMPQSCDLPCKITYRLLFTQTPSVLCTYWEANYSHKDSKLRKALLPTNQSLNEEMEVLTQSVRHTYWRMKHHHPHISNRIHYAASN